MGKDSTNWAEIIFVPLVVGFSLVYADISMVLFKMIGWALLLFGILALVAYLTKQYTIHKEKIKEVKEKILRAFPILKRSKNEI